MSWHPGGAVGNPHARPEYSGRNRQPSGGGPSGVQRSSAVQLRENEPLFNTYEHLQGLQRGDAALTMLRKVASMVKPIMQKHGWKVQILAEFLPPEHNLLGLNYNKGYKICLRLRYHNNPDLFLPLEQVVDTMLHELSHNVWGDHDSNFHKLWDELRDEHEALLRKGYTGEGFLAEGKRLGGSGGRGVPPQHEMRRLARASAEKRKAQGTLGQGSGRRLGGTPLHQQGKDVRSIIADQATRRNNINKGCGSGRQDAEKLSQDASNNTFKTKAEEDDANNRAIAQALYELMEEEELRKLHGTAAELSSNKDGLAWSSEHGLYDANMTLPTPNRGESRTAEEEQMKWAMSESLQSTSESSTPSAPTGNPKRTTSAPPVPVASKPAVKPQPVVDLTACPEPQNTRANDQWECEICTYFNPPQYLACDMCGIERPQSSMAKGKQPSKSDAAAKTRKPPNNAVRSSRSDMPPPPKPKESLGWNCGSCGAFMEHKWWTCSACGTMKTAS